MNNLYEAIDNARSMTVDDIPIETKTDVVMDFFAKVEEMETRNIDVKLLLNLLCDTLSFFTFVNISNKIDASIVDLIALALEEQNKRL